MKNMKKGIQFFAALFLTLAAAPAFANHLQPVEPKEIADPDAKSHFGAGVQAFMSDDFDQAAKHFQAAEAAEPDIPEIHVDLAMALAAQGNTDTARKHFDEAGDLIAEAGPPLDTMAPG
ncbi:MAG TPA: tetratricopeptide repeat protein [Candidatus Manganitrophaceae bacterium]|nr:tetratricopeptide repeat protein [Candidatus Manganitrophaceae bacterium]